MKIYTPVKDFNGCRNNVRFVNGVGETDDPALINWFVTHGYKCEKCDEYSQNSLEKCDESEFVGLNEIIDDEPEMMGYADRLPKEPDFESMNPLELREWAKANGFGALIKNTRNKDKLIEILRG